MTKYQQNASKDVKPVEQVAGGLRRTLVDGAKMMLIEWTFKKGVVVPLHQHPHEQCGYIVKGKMIFTCDGEEHVLTPGMSYLVQGNVPHGAQFAAATVAVDIFSPPRADYRGDKPSQYKIVKPKAAPNKKQSVPKRK